MVVDTEPKAARAASASHVGLGARLRPECLVVGKTGRGSNFAFGYNGASGSAAAMGSRRATAAPPAFSGSAASRADAAEEGALLARAMEAIRAEAERMWMLANLVVVMSTGGGTGSGLGARLVRELRDAYPTRFIAAVAILPFASGESPLQHYNTVLCADVLQRDADIILTFSNDQALELSLSNHATQTNSSSTASSVQTGGGGGSSISSSSGGGGGGGGGKGKGQRQAVAAGVVGGLHNMNLGIAAAIAGALLPVTDDSGRNHAGKRGDLWELCAAVCPAPTWKFVEVHHAAHSAAARAVVAHMRMPRQHSAFTGKRALVPSTSAPSAPAPAPAPAPALASASAPAPSRPLSGRGAGRSGGDVGAGSRVRGRGGVGRTSKTTRSGKAKPPRAPAASSNSGHTRGKSSSSSSSLVASSRFQAAGNALVVGMLDKLPIYTRVSSSARNPGAHHRNEHDALQQQQPVQTIASQLLFRGGCGPRTETESTKLAAKLRKTLRAPAWSPFPCDMRHDIGDAAAAWGSATLVANRTSVAAPLQHALTRAKQMHAVKAYWHWYQQFGMEEDTLLAAFENVGNVVEAYTAV